MQKIKEIPLSELTAWNGNIRKIGGNKELKSLAASIAAHGLLQSLVVKYNGKKPEVIAGKRRLMALNMLAKDKQLEAKHLVPCIITDEKNAAEASLAENVVREPMHPSDQFEAFQLLVDKEGLAIADIAARFGTTETIVNKRLKLANVSPGVMTAYRAGGISLEQVQAFAVTDDKDAQEALLNEIISDDRSGFRSSPGRIRKSLTEGRVNAADKRVKFVTIELYEKAGGIVERDLFSDNDEGIFITDVSLLNKMVQQQLQAEVEKVKAEGWNWVESKVDFDYADYSKMTRHTGEQTPVPPSDQLKIDALVEEEEKILDADDLTEEQENRLGEIQEEIDVLEDTPEKFEPDVVQTGGAVIAIGYGGKPEIRRGYVRPKEAKAAKKDKAKADDKPKASVKEQAESAAPEDATLTKALTEELTAHRTAALAAVLSDNPNVALALMVHKLVNSLFTQYGTSCLKINAERWYSPKSVQENGGSKGADYLQKKIDAFKPPKDKKDLMAWCLGKTQDELLDILALCTAMTLDTTNYGSQGQDSDTNQAIYATQLADALKINITDWFTPTAENFYNRLNKISVFIALKEALAIDELPPAWLKLKKAELGPFAEREIKATDRPWLPTVLRLGVQPEKKPAAKNVSPKKKTAPKKAANTQAKNKGKAA